MDGYDISLFPERVCLSSIESFCADAKIRYSWFVCTLYKFIMRVVIIVGKCGMEGTNIDL